MIYNTGIIFSWISFVLLVILFFNKKEIFTEILVRLNLFVQVFLFCLLEMGLFLNDFSISYIANYSAKSTPPLYKFASLWGSLDGSILLWNLCLSFFMYLYLKSYKDLSSDMDIKIFSLIMIFFVGYTVFSSSPFAGCIELAAVGCNNSSLLPFQELVTSNIGRGPNPLLQNHPLMAIHPPILYIGYVGMTMPFVAATSRLYSKKQNANDWIEVAEKTTYIPWLFLTIGITLGAAWSYEVLGWGGYWAWDPVENVSFIPWLLATAFLHSSKAQLNESTLLNWNYVLGGLMFLSTIFGTFITRSGVLISVHAFSNGNIGVFLLSGLAIFTLFFVYTGSKNIEYFSTSKKLGNLFGKSGFFIANNIFLFVSALIIFIGTVYPIFYENFYKRQLTIGRSFFDILIGPLLLILLLMMIFSIRLSKKNINFNEWFQQNLLSLNISLIISIIITYTYRFEYLGILTVFGAMSLLIAGVKNLIPKIKQKRIKGSYWAGQLAHIGIAVFSLGLILNVTQSYSSEFIVNENSIVEFGGKTYTIDKAYEVSREEKDIINLPISSNTNIKNASLNIFKNSSQQAISSPAIFRTFEYDTYITIKFIDSNNFKLIFRKNYGILIMWIGLALSTTSFIPKVKQNEK